MLTILNPSIEIAHYITERCAVADPFLLQDLREACAPGLTVLIEARTRMLKSYYWGIVVEAPSYFFEDFSEFCKTSRVSVPENTVMAGYVYLLEQRILDLRKK